MIAVATTSSTSAPNTGCSPRRSRYPADYSSVTFRLRPEARWHDGEPITAEDVVWSFEKTVELNPNQRFYYSHVDEGRGDRASTR